MRRQYLLEVCELSLRWPRKRTRKCFTRSHAQPAGSARRERAAPAARELVPGGSSWPSHGGGETGEPGRGVDSCALCARGARARGVADAGRHRCVWHVRGHGPPRTAETPVGGPAPPRSLLLPWSRRLASRPGLLTAQTAPTHGYPGTRAIADTARETYGYGPRFRYGQGAGGSSGVDPGGGGGKYPLQLRKPRSITYAPTTPALPPRPKEGTYERPLDVAHPITTGFAHQQDQFGLLPPPRLLPAPLPSPRTCPGPWLLLLPPRPPLPPPLLPAPL